VCICISVIDTSTSRTYTPGQHGSNSRAAIRSGKVPVGSNDERAGKYEGNAHTQVHDGAEMRRRASMRASECARERAMPDDASLVLAGADDIFPQQARRQSGWCMCQ